LLHEAGVLIYYSSVSLSVRPHGTVRLLVPEFSCNFILRIFTVARRYSLSVKIGQKFRYFTQGSLYIYVIGV